MNIAATVAIRSRSHIIMPKQHPFDRKFLRRYDVLLVLGWAFISMSGYITLLFSMSAFATSIGLNSSRAATVTALLNLGTAIGRPFIGFISDKFGRIETAGFITLSCAVSVFAIWIPARSYGILVFFVIVNGAILLGVFWVVSRLLTRCQFLILTEMKTIGPICVEVVGLQELPSMLSIAWLAIVFPTICKFVLILFAKRIFTSAVSEVIALKLRRPESVHEFLYPQIYAGLMYLVASTVTLELWRIRRKSALGGRASS
jgi:MFS family permease